MKKHIQLILTTIVLALALSLVPAHTASANGQVRLISDIREDFNGLLLQLRVFDNSCVIITGGLLDELRTLILDGRKLITTNKGNLGPALVALVLRAQVQLQSLIVHVAIYCGFEQEINPGPFSEPVTVQAKAFTPLGFPITFGGIAFIGNQIELLRAEIAAIEELDERKSNKIDGLLTDALAHASAILSLSDDILDEGGCLFDFSQALNRVGRIFESAEIVTIPVLPQLTETGPISFDELREIKLALGLAANAIKDCLHTLRQITKEKKWLYKDIREVKELLRASNFGGRAASELPILTESPAKVYSLNGNLVATHATGLNINQLANGVYLIVSGNTIRKMTINR
jgi:hypothetical protein